MGEGIFENLKALDISDNTLYPILSVLNMAIMITDANGDIQYYSPLHAEMDDLLAEDVLGRNVCDVYQLDDESSLIKRALKTVRPIVDCPVLYKTQSGKLVDSVHNVIPLVKNGEVSGAISIIKDYQTVKDTGATPSSKPSQLSFNGETDFCLDDIIGSNATLLNAVNRARMAALTDSPVLIHGETGTGKELFAQSIHNLSNRKNERYIAVNCSAIPENLLEGILFGTTKGAFTGALDKAGLFERANGGTIFLDEINSMNQEMQPKLLRVIQEKRVCRVGSHRETKLDVKIIGSINTSLEQAILSGEIRSDLLFRLSVVYITLPPLRKRKDDLIELIQFFLGKYNERLKKTVTGVSQEVYQVFQRHNWPGNIRELENTIEGCLNMVGKDSLIEKWHLVSGFDLFGQDRLNEASQDTPNRDFAERLKENFTNEMVSGAPPISLEQHKEKERQELQDALLDADGNITDAAIILGISRQTFYRRVKKLKIQLPKKDLAKDRDNILSALRRSKGNVTQAAKGLGISRELLKYRLSKLGIDRSQF